MCKRLIWLLLWLLLHKCTGQCSGNSLRACMLQWNSVWKSGADDETRQAMFQKHWSLKEVTTISFTHICVVPAKHMNREAWHAICA